MCVCVCVCVCECVCVCVHVSHDVMVDSFAYQVFGYVASTNSI